MYLQLQRFKHTAHTDAGVLMMLNLPPGGHVNTHTLLAALCVVGHESVLRDYSHPVSSISLSLLFHF